MTLLAVSISAGDADSFHLQLKAAYAHGADVIEIRADALKFPDSETVIKLLHSVKRMGLPVIVTCRDIDEGGVSEVPFSQKLEILKKAIEEGAEYVDIELRKFKHPDVHSVLKAALEFSETRLIMSAHNFQGPFEDARIVYESILSLYPEAIPKIVFKANHLNDCFTAFELLMSADVPMTTFCMGPAGQVSRVLAKKLGAHLTYAAVDDASAAAPGQLSISQMKDLYRWDVINKETEIFGVIGNPIGHSLSPHLFNACFENDQINALYLPFLIEGDMPEFAQFLDHVHHYPKMGFGGFSVTLPHKSNALNYAGRHGDYVDPLAVSIGSVNTLKIGFNGLISAYNTDYAGAMDALTSVVGRQKHRLHQAKVAVVGAGGVSRAVVAGLIDAGANVTIYNRTLSRARSLAEEFQCRAEELEAVAKTDAEIVINCTSIGMSPKTDACPLPEGVIRKDMTVFDTIYNPLETELLKKARAAGAKTVDGAAMFVRQAMAQYKIFIGQDPDEDLMRKIVLDCLNRK